MLRYFEPQITNLKLLIKSGLMYCPNLPNCMKKSSSVAILRQHNGLSL